MLKDPLGGPLDLNSMAKLEKDFTPDQLARAVTLNRFQNMHGVFLNYTNTQKARFFKNGRWIFPETVLADAAKAQGLNQQWINVWMKDPWGEQFRVVAVEKKRDHQTGQTQYDHHEIVSAGPDRKFGTDDDVKMGDPNQWQQWQVWWSNDSKKLAQWGQGDLANFGRMERRQMLMQQLGGRGGMPVADLMMERAGAVPMAAPRPGAAPPPVMKTAEAKEAGQPAQEGGGAAPMRVREYFPETLLWKPALITNDRGEAVLPITFADSITTWRLSASASSRGGALGGVSAPLRVFQDFFVDLDLPVSLTQNDEVAFPVAVYNYLKQPQTVKLELVQAPWFELVDAGGLSRSLDLKPNEVTAVKFRIRASKIGYQPLQVNARGSKMSDAIKRVIEIVPDGAKVEKVVTDRLTGKVAQTVAIPEHAVPDASKILVKIYPGVFSQVIEGTEGMLRMPFG
jgi:hypothetical protein